MIELPTWPAPSSAEPYFIDAGGWQTPAFSGGDVTRIDRLGDHHGLAVTMPPMRLQDDPRGIHARQWISRLKRGMGQGVRIRFPQPGFTPPTGLASVGQVRTALAAQADRVDIQGLPVSRAGALLEGQFVTLVHGTTGKRSLHSINASVASDGSGRATVEIHPRTRRSYPAVSSTVLIGRPEIEGRLIGDRQAWTLETVRLVGISFEIEEF